MNIVFCNITWMKYYEGVNAKDMPYNGGAFVKNNGDAAESKNFLDYNGKCYGFVQFNGKCVLEKHFQGVASNQAFINNVLVVWVATNKKKETKIVGWYKNARVYREQKERQLIFDPENSGLFRVEANSKDCFLISENERSFLIERANKVNSGMGMGRSNIWYAESENARNILIPNVIRYIENYEGQRENFVITPEITSAIFPENDPEYSDYPTLMKKGEEYFAKDIYLSIKYFNSARKLNECSEALTGIYKCLMALLALNEALEILDKMVEIEGQSKQRELDYCIVYDAMGNRQKTLEHCENYLKYEAITNEDKDMSVMVCIAIAMIYGEKKDETNAMKSLNRMLLHSYNEEHKKSYLEIKAEFEAWFLNC